MRILGLLFILFGLLLCLTLIFAWHGLATIAVGALLYMAGERKREQSGGAASTSSRWQVIVASLVVAVLLLIALGNRKPAGPGRAASVSQQMTQPTDSPAKQHSGRRHGAAH